MCAAHGAAFLSDTFFDPERALELIERERATILYPAYPPITQAVLTHPTFSRTDLSTARAIVNVAPPDSLRQMQAALPKVIQLSLYGLTEGGAQSPTTGSTTTSTCAWEPAARRSLDPRCGSSIPRPTRTSQPTARARSSFAV